MFDTIRRLVCWVRGCPSVRSHAEVDQDTIRRMQELPNRLDRLIAVEQGRNPVEQTIKGRRHRKTPPPRRRESS